ncbi:MAG: glycine zipper 2TM domain-containing protein [Gammaproteobacteria bacterium]|nr:glycine zipper 2TM domain-containing protein [Gammaproteobacteria bacterium]MBU2479027.1 glycine zipper 2TM domain-containing protein [Gammaproteobacteria bacterium]
MDKSMLAGIGIGVVVATAGGAIAGFNLLGEKAPTHADVLSVSEVTKTVQVPREVCEDVAVTHQQPVKDENRIVGTVAGAVIGGVLGNQVGGGSGKKIATVAGVAAGGYAGNKVQQNMQAKDTYTDVEKRCRQVNESQVKLIGYDVSYKLGDETGSVRMDHRPGARIPVADGQLVLTEQPALDKGPR